MKKIQNFVAFILFAFYSQTLFANTLLNIVVEGGQVGGIPIAIAPFQSDTALSNVENIKEIIQNDLSNSGQFKVVAQSGQTPKNEKEVQYSYWQKEGVDDLVIGNIKKQNGRYQVSFQLLDIIHQKTGAYMPPLISMQFDNIAPHEFRALAHHISDLIFEKLTGAKGIFSTRIAYVSVIPGHPPKTDTIHTLEIADADGYNPKILYRSNRPIMSPAWSPDAKKIAYVSFENDRSSIQVVDLTSGRREKVTQFPGINGAPAWSPDGHTLALVLSKEGNPKIYTFDLRNKRLTRVTDGAWIDTEPTFAPDGRSILFTSNRGGKPQIYRVNLATSQIDRLTFHGDYNAKPSLSPDGKCLVMLHRNDSDGFFSIAMQNLQSNDFRILTQASLNDSPSLAPNGLMVLYGSLEGGRGVLGGVTIDGRVKIRLPARQGDVQQPAWAPLARN